MYEVLLVDPQFRSAREYPPWLAMPIEVFVRLVLVNVDPAKRAFLRLAFAKFVPVKLAFSMNALLRFLPEKSHPDRSNP